MALKGAERRELLRSWYDDSLAAGILYAQWLHQECKSTIGQSYTDEGRWIASTSNAGQSVSFEPGSSGDQGEVITFLAEAADVAATLAPQYPNDDAALLQRLIADLGTPLRQAVHTYQGMRLR